MIYLYVTSRYKTCTNVLSLKYGWPIESQSIFLILTIAHKQVSWKLTMQPAPD